METDTMKCEKCGGQMIKIDEDTLKCEECGIVANLNNKKDKTV